MQDDVITSTRVRLARNLADFPFVSKMSLDDKNRVDSLVFDAFSSDQSFNHFPFNNVANEARQLLVDKGIIKNNECTSVVLDDKETVSVLVNSTDHVRIASFVYGLDCEKGMENVYKVDEFLQNKLQFAASYEFGYLTSRIKDCGTGMKISFRCFIPSIILMGKMQEIVDFIHKNHFSLIPVFKSNDESGDFANCIFDVETSCASIGTELDQMAAIAAAGTYILTTERKFRKEFADNNHTVVLNFVKQAFAKGMYSLLLSYVEGVNIISGIKWGLQTGILTGAEEKELNELYYKTKQGHLRVLCDNVDFSFSEDIQNDMELKIQRLRTVLIQQTLDKIKFKD